MPGGDRTGPQGSGPMTGRGMGYCAGYATPGNAGAGFGRGRGRGFRRMYRMTGLPGYARCGEYPDRPADTAAAVVDEKEILLKQADFLEEQLKAVRKRLEGFEKDE